MFASRFHRWGFLLALGLCGCGSPGGGFHGSDGGDATAPTDAHSPDDAIYSKDVVSLGESSADVAVPGSDVVFAQSKDTLYRLDPTTDKLATVGPFTGCGEVLDIAVDGASGMYATTLDGLYTIDTTTAACTLVAMGSSYPNSLSFVPAGTLDPKVEALVGYVADSYVRIDTTTGAVTTIGSIGQGYSSSGDIVSVKGGGTYLTVKGGPQGTCDDCLIQVDPTTGSFVFSWGALNRSDVYGLAFWAGDVYGFDTAGDLFQVKFDGMAMQVTSLPFPGEPAGLQWFGAGSTTSAPLAPPK